MTWWQWLNLGFAAGWVVRSTVHWLGWIGEEGVRARGGVSPSGKERP